MPPSQNERRERAFLAVIRYAEGNKEERADQYNRRNGGSHFYDMSRYPGNAAPGAKTSASGAYQIVQGTFNDLVKRGAPNNMYPETQDAMALMLIGRKGAMTYIHEENLAAAFSLLNTTWSALPGGREPHITEAEGEAYFRKKLDEHGK